MVKSHLVDLDYYKILESQKGVPNLTIYYTQKNFSSCYNMKENFKNNKA